MDQTPVHEQHNPDLLAMIPATAGRLIEIGCSSGAMAREFRKLNAACHYVGVEIDEEYGKLAERFCDAVIIQDMDLADDGFYERYSDRQVWIFGDSLEHLKDPWKVLRAIRKHIPADGIIAACIPNAQHWSVQAHLAAGTFFYQPSGLMDRTHLRWFTRQTIFDLFSSTGFQITRGMPRVFPSRDAERFLPAIRAMAAAAGANPKTAADDALPLQYIVVARPA